MKSFTNHLLVLFCASVLSACGSSTGAKSQPPAIERAEQESQRWQQQYETEGNLRQQAEIRSTVQQEARSRWQNIATVFGIAAVVLLVLGTILGSAARHESEKL